MTFPFYALIGLALVTQQGLSATKERSVVVVLAGTITEEQAGEMSKPAFWDAGTQQVASNTTSEPFWRIDTEKVRLLLDPLLARPFIAAELLDGLRGGDLYRTKKLSKYPDKVQASVRALATGFPDLATMSNSDAGFRFSLSLIAQVDPNDRRSTLDLMVLPKHVEAVINEHDPVVIRKSRVPLISQRVVVPPIARGRIVVTKAGPVDDSKIISEAFEQIDLAMKDTKERAARTARDILDGLGERTELIPGWDGTEPLNVSQLDEDAFRSLLQKLPSFDTPAGRDQLRRLTLSIQDVVINLEFRAPSGQLIIYGLPIRGVSPNRPPPPVAAIAPL